MSRSIFTQVCCTCISYVLLSCCPFHPPRHCAMFMWIFKFCNFAGNFIPKSAPSPHLWTTKPYSTTRVPLQRTSATTIQTTTCLRNRYNHFWLDQASSNTRSNASVYLGSFLWKKYSLANTRANTNYINNGRQKKSLQRYRFAFAQISITFHNLGTALVRNIVATFFKSIELLYLSLLQYPASNHNKDLHHHHRLQATDVLSNRWIWIRWSFGGCTGISKGDETNRLSCCFRHAT